MFNPGETIAHTFVIPFRRVDLSEVIISYKQNDEIIFERRITSSREFMEHRGPDGEIDPIRTEIRIVLTQEESLLFLELSKFTIQLNVLTASGSRHASATINGSNGVQHHKEVMPNE